jgi:hypothetical protein
MSVISALLATMAMERRVAMMWMNVQSTMVVAIRYPHASIKLGHSLVVNVRKAIQALVQLVVHRSMSALQTCTIVIRLFNV